VKIIGIVQSCKSCPNRVYDSGGMYECEKVRQSLAPDCVIPPWCPLADHPAAEMASLVRSLELLNQQQARSHAEVLRLAAIVNKYEPGTPMVLS